MNKITISNQVIYYTEIVHPEEFKNLYLKETPLLKFFSKVTTKTDRPFFTFYAKDRKKHSFEEKDVILIRIEKAHKNFQLIVKISRWGKIHVPAKVVKILGLKNHERIICYVLNRDKKVAVQNSERHIDLAKLSKDNEVRIIPREGRNITIYKKQKTPITVPRFIEITPDLIELCFLIHGDGHYQNKLYFVNKAPELINFVMHQFDESLRIPKNCWRAKIDLFKGEDKECSKEYWKSKLELEDKQFYKTAESSFNTGKNGNLRIIIDKTIVSMIFKNIFYKITEELDKETAFYALNGLLDAEGGSQLNSGSLHRITLSFNENEKKLFENVLKNTGILKFCKITQNKTFVIEKWDNQYIFFKAFLKKGIVPFKTHNKRRNNAINGFLRHSFTKTMIKYLSACKESEKLTIKDLSILMRIRQDSILDTIRKNRYQKFINFEKIKGKKCVSISEEGLIFLDLIEIMNKLKEGAMKGELPFEKIKRDILVKREERGNFGQKPDERSIEQLMHYGIININKPAGPT